MNTVSGSSSYSTKASTNKGISGLVSGMDTESMVEQMLSGTQSKIDKANGEKQTLTWKQEFYRDIITSINNFQNTFFGYGATTNIMSEAFFNSMSALSSSSAVKVTANSSAATGNTSIDVLQLATATSFKSNAVSGDLSSKIDQDKLDKMVAFRLNGGSSVVKVDLKDINKESIEREMQRSNVDEDTAINTLLNTAFSGSGIDATYADGKVSLKATNGTDTISISSQSSAMGITTLGIGIGSSGTSLQGALQKDVQATMQVVVDGKQKTITLNDFDAAGNAGHLLDNLQKSLNKEFGNGVVKVKGLDASGNDVGLTTGASNFKLEVSAGRQVVLNSGSAALDILGVEAGRSNKVGMGTKLSDLNFAGMEMQGDRFSFTINDVDFSFSADTTLYNVIKEINNNSDADVRITYSELEDKFTIERDSTGKGYGITMSQKEGNFLTGLFGVDAGSSTAGKTLTLKEIKGTRNGSMSSIQSDAELTLNVNGTKVKLTLPRDSKGNKINYTESQALQALNNQLRSKFGYTSDDEQNIELNADGSITNRNGSVITFDKIADTATDEELKTNITYLLGFADKTSSMDNIAKATTNIKDVFGFANTETDTVSDYFAGKPGYVFEAESGRVIADNTVPGADFTTPPLPVLNEILFGKSTVSFGSSAVTDSDTATGGNVTKGQNAIVILNGVETERSSNTFTMGGLSIEANAVTGSYIQGRDMTTSITPPVAPSTKPTIGGNEITLENGATFNPGKKIFEIDGKYYQEGSGIDSDGYLLGTDGKKVVNGDTVKVETTRNTDKIVDGIKSFVEEYNKMIDKLNKLVDQKATYKDYPPLTSAQKKEMSDKEIELWEEKAKTGLLRNDTYVSSFLSQMRTVLYSKPAGADLALYDFGIETSNDWRDKGKLVIKDEAALKQKIEANPEAIRALFTGTDGIGTQMNKICDATAKSSSGTPGSLVQVAGMEGKATEKNNDIYKRLTSLNDRIKDLQKKYETERARYWQQFNNMEKMLSQMNSQSNWLAQQFG